MTITSNKNFIVDSNIIIYSLFSEFVEFNLNEESLSKVALYEQLEAGSRLVPFFIAAESISVIVKRFYKLLKTKLAAEEIPNLERLIKLCVGNFYSSHKVFSVENFLHEDFFEKFNSIDYLATPSLTFTDISLAITANKLGLDLLTCDKNLIKFYDSLN